jgi:hypothetical protein
MSGKVEEFNNSKKQDKNLEIAKILATIAPFFLIASGIFSSNANSEFSELIKLNLFQIENRAILTTNDTDYIIRQKDILPIEKSYSQNVSAILFSLGLLLTIFSLFMLVMSTEKILKFLLISLLFLVIVVSVTLLLIIVFRKTIYASLGLSVIISLVFIIALYMLYGVFSKIYNKIKKKK